MFEIDSYNNNVNTALNINILFKNHKVFFELY